MIFVIVVPFLGVLVYLIAEHDGMRERSVKQAAGSAAGSSTSTCATRRGRSAAEIAQAKELLDSGAITQAEFDAHQGESARIERRPN